MPFPSKLGQGSESDADRVRAAQAKNDGTDRHSSEMSDDEGWTTVNYKKVSRPSGPRPAPQVAAPVDHSTVVLRRSGAAPRGPTQTVARPTAGNKATGGLGAYYAKVEERIEAGDYQSKKYDQDFINSVKAYRAKQGMKQSELARALNLQESIIKQLEAGSLPYDPKVKAKISSLLA